ncbi:MAG: hypothetical protein FJ386_05820 [Verrucomicrobia bacterium]|nr:hypothetical protein [Verrucomicrobiota bacterium]
MKRVLLASLAAFASSGLGAAPGGVEAMLAREIIGPRLTQAEVEDYVENHVPLMPAVKSAGDWDRLASKMRADVLDFVVYRGAAAQWRNYAGKVEWLDTIEGGPGYSIRKLRYEVLPGMWTCALLYVPAHISGKVPVHLAVNGHDANGKQSPYKQVRCAHLARNGVISLNVEWFGMGQLRTPGFAHASMNQLDLCGTSGWAPFFLQMKRGLDILLALPQADPQRVAVSGLSGGGWGTIIISSLDTRVTLCNPVAGYSSFRTRVRNHSDLGDSEQTPNDLALWTDYAHMTAMLAPRAALITKNAKDNCCFASGHALQPLLDAAEPIYKLHGKPDRLRSHVNYLPGNHNFDQDNREAFYRIVRDVFYGGSHEFAAKESALPSDVKPKEQLDVPLPADNVDFNKLALTLASSLPLNAGAPADAAALKPRRAKLRDIVRAKDYTVEAGRAGAEEKDGVKAVFWRLKLAGEWTLPAVELTRGEAKTTVVLISDAGRKASAAEVEKHLAAGRRVVAVDPYYFGESKIASRDWLFSLLLASVGDRPVGLQASQVGAVARWAHKQHGAPVSLASIGPRTSVVALVAAALEEKSVASVDTVEPLGSLKELIGRNVAVSQQPEMFCFGLLEHFDVPQLRALAKR